jgi:hypothetical protein
MKVTTEQGIIKDEPFTADKLNIGEVAVVVESTSGGDVGPGDIIVRGWGEVVFPGIGTWSNNPTKYKVRRLKSDERVVIERDV